MLIPVDGSLQFVKLLKQKRRYYNGLITLVEDLSETSGVEHKVDSSMKSHISESPKSSSEEVSSSTVVLEEDNPIASSRC